MPNGKPNVLVMFGDDIGFWNISHNNRGMMGYSTPNIDRLAKEGVAFNLERPAEEVESHERRLAALPRQGHEGHLLALNRLPDECLGDLVGHALVASGVERRLLQEEAVVAAQVTARPSGLGHDVEGRGGDFAHTVMVRDVSTAGCETMSR